MLAIMIALFVVPDNLQIVIIRYFFTYYISLFRSQNLNIKKQNEMTDFIFPSMRVFILRKLKTLDIKVFVKSVSLMLLSNRV